MLVVLCASSSSNKTKSLFTSWKLGSVIELATVKLTIAPLSSVASSSLQYYNKIPDVFK